MNTKRKIEDFRVIERQVGFHVSECTEGTHYLKAEEDLKATQENASEIKNSHNFLVELAKELF